MNSPLTNINRYQLFMHVYMIACCVAIFANAILNPSYVWDMLGYAASVHSLNGMGMNELHSAVYTELKANSTAFDFKELTSSTSYRITMSSNPEAFSQQIPFYRIRIIFIMLINSLMAIGFGVFEAMHILSSGFASAGLLLVYISLWRNIHPLLWLPIPIIFFGVTADLTLTQQGGVDTFTFFWTSLTVISYVRNSKFLLPILAVSVLVRTDLIIFTALLYAVLLVSDKSNRTQIVLWAALTIAAYFAVNTWAGNYGWHALIHFVFVTDMLATHPASYSLISTFDFQDYLRFITTLYTGISKWFWVCLSCAPLSFLGYLWMYQKLPRQFQSPRLKEMQRLNIICIVSLVYIAFHYILYPAIFMRFFTGPCLFIVISTFCTFSYIYQTKNELNSKKSAF